jgi:GT2 family glycosyltransferase
MSARELEDQAPDLRLLSAVVATLGRLDCLGACLQALRDSSVPYAEAIVVHQGDDPAVAALAERDSARYARLAVRGLSRARNHGVALARGTWIFFPDDDCIPDREFGRTIMRFLAEHPELRFACGRVHDEQGTVLAPAMGGHTYPIRTRRDVLRGVVSAGLVVERAALEAVGGFDERLGAGAEFPSGEESDLVFRLLDAGYPGAYTPAAAVVHAEPYAVRSPQQQTERAYHYGRGWGALLAKHASGAHGHDALVLFAEYLARAAAGAALAALRGRSADAARYRASLRGRWRGFHDWRRAIGAAPC